MQGDRCGGSGCWFSVFIYGDGEALRFGFESDGLTLPSFAPSCCITVRVRSWMLSLCETFLQKMCSVTSECIHGVNSAGDSSRGKKDLQVLSVEPCVCP